MSQPRGGDSEHPVLDVVSRRRSIRHFRSAPIDSGVLQKIVEVGLIAPAPHHTRPWRFVVVTTEATRAGLANAMAEKWRVELEREGNPESQIAEMLQRSIDRLTSAPALIVACLDERDVRQRTTSELNSIEWAMAQFSLGAALENMMLVAVEEGLGTCWIASPLYCPEEVVQVLDLPATWSPQALVAVGIPDSAHGPPERDAIDAREYIEFR